MLDILKKELGRFLKERLPILAIDLLIDGTRWAKEITDRSAKLLADGTVPGPGFLVDRARAYVKEQEDMHRVLEPDEEWESRPLEPEPPPAKPRAARTRKPKAAAPRAKTARPKRPRRKPAPPRDEGEETPSQ